MPNKENHGLSNTVEYKAWKRMKNRCYNKNDNRYHDWGGRGIRVCDRWINSFTNFLSDVGLRPSDKHSLDRIDNNGNYEPNNCKWSTGSEQSRNRRNSTSSTGCPGVFNMPNNRYRSRITIRNKQINLGCFDTLFEAACSRKSAEVNYV